MPIARYGLTPTFRFDETLSLSSETAEAAPSQTQEGAQIAPPLIPLPTVFTAPPAVAVLIGPVVPPGPGIPGASLDSAHDEASFSPPTFLLNMKLLCH